MTNPDRSQGLGLEMEYLVEENEDEDVTNVQKGVGSEFLSLGSFRSSRKCHPIR